jgi:hypothetical protein
MKNTITIRNQGIVKPVYKFKGWQYEDQFWNIIEWKVCSCWKLDIKRNMIVYTNYGWAIRKLYVCNKCIDDFWENNRFNRDKNKLKLF